MRTKSVMGVAVAVFAVIAFVGTATSGAKPARGKPLKVLVSTFINSPVGSVPEIFAGAQIAAQNINRQGGVNGRPIEVVTCNTKGDPTAELACARKGVSRGAIASVDNVFVVNPAGALAILNRAKIADIAGAGGQPANYSLPVMFPIDYSPGGNLGCMSKQALGVQKNSKVSVMAQQQPFSQGSTANFERAVAKNPSVKPNYVGSVAAPLPTVDWSPFVQKLDKLGANYVVPTLGPTDSAIFVAAAASSGKKWVFCADAGLLSPANLTKIGPLTKATLVDATFPPISEAKKYPLVDQFVREMNAAAKAGNKNADLKTVNAANSERAWMGMQVFKKVVSTMRGPVTATTFYRTIKNAKVDLGWAKLDFAKPLGTAPFRRVFQGSGWVSRWDTKTKGTKLVSKVNLLGIQAGHQ